jgi:DNA-binding response OmpR family regulator
MGPDTPRRRVLIVEDEAPIRERVKPTRIRRASRLTNWRRPRCAERTRATGFDLLILDVMLPA